MIGSRWRLKARLIRALTVAAGLAVGAGAFAAEDAVPVPIVTIYPGDVIGNEMLQDKRFRLTATSQRALVTDRAQLVGKVARRTLLAGRPIAPNAVKVPELIVQGRAVMVIYNADGVMITGQAMPLEAGHAGSLISLRNIDSGRVIKGIVQTDGSVVVGGQ